MVRDAEAGIFHRAGGIHGGDLVPCAAADIADKQRIGMGGIGAGGRAVPADHDLVIRIHLAHIDHILDIGQDAGRGGGADRRRLDLSCLVEGGSSGRAGLRCQIQVCSVVGHFICAATADGHGNILHLEGNRLGGGVARRILRHGLQGMRACAQQTGIGIQGGADDHPVQGGDDFLNAVCLGDCGVQPDVARQSCAGGNAHVHIGSGVVHDELHGLGGSAVGDLQGMLTVGQLGGVQLHTHRIHRGGRHCKAHIHVRTPFVGVADAVDGIKGGAEIGLGAGIHAVITGGTDGGRQIGIAVCQLQLDFADLVILPVGRGGDIGGRNRTKGACPQSQRHLVVSAAVGKVAVVDKVSLCIGNGILPCADVGDDLVAGGGQRIAEACIPSVRIEGQVGAILDHGGGGLLGAVDINGCRGIGAAIVGRHGNRATDLLALGNIGADAADRVKALDVHPIDTLGGGAVRVGGGDVKLHILVVKQLIGCQNGFVHIGYTHTAFRLAIPVTGAVKAIVYGGIQAAQTAVVLIIEVDAQIFALHDGVRNGHTVMQPQLDTKTGVLDVLGLLCLHRSHGGGNRRGIGRHTGTVMADLVGSRGVIRHIRVTVVEDAGHLPVGIAGGIHAEHLKTAQGVVQAVLSGGDVHGCAAGNAVGIAESRQRGEAGGAGIQTRIAVDPDHRCAAGRNGTAGGRSHMIGSAGAVLVNRQQLALRLLIGINQLILLVQGHGGIGGVGDLEALHIVRSRAVAGAAVHIIGADLSDGHFAGIIIGNDGLDIATDLIVVHITGRRQIHALIQLHGGLALPERHFQLTGQTVLHILICGGGVGAEGGACGLELDGEGGRIIKAFAVGAFQQQGIVGNPQIITDLGLGGQGDAGCVTHIGALVPDDDGLTLFHRNITAAGHGGDGQQIAVGVDLINIVELEIPIMGGDHLYEFHQIRCRIKGGDRNTAGGCTVIRCFASIGIVGIQLCQPQTFSVEGVIRQFRCVRNSKGGDDSGNQLRQHDHSQQQGHPFTNILHIKHFLSERFQ